MHTMPNASGFSSILKLHLSRHKARINCLASIITALFVRQLAMNGWRICIRQGFLTASAARCADSGKKWCKAGVEWPLSGAENRGREKIGAGDAIGQRRLVVCRGKEGKGIEACGERWQTRRCLILLLPKMQEQAAPISAYSTRIQYLRELGAHSKEFRQ